MDEPLQLLTFRLEVQRYAIPLRDVREVLRAVAITPLPEGPALVEGVIDVRGALVPVLDLRARLDLPRRPVWLTDHLVLAHDGSRDVALRVDEVEAVVPVPRDALHEARELTPDAEFVRGVARLPDGLVVIHDLRRFLSPSESASLAAALGAHAAHEERP